MRNLFLYITLLISSFIFSQDIRMTTLLHSSCPIGGGPSLRFVELYINGSLDVTGLELQFQDSFATHWYGSTSIGTGTITNSYIYVVISLEAFDREFPNIRTSNNTVSGFLANTVFGGNKMRLIDTNNSNTILDIYGVDGVDGQNESWNYFTSYAKRLDGNGPNNTFDESEWDIKPVDNLLFKGVCWGNSSLDNLVSLGDYSATLALETYNYSNNQISVFPNPISSNEVLSLKTNLEFDSAKVFDICGKKVGDYIISNNQLKLKNISKGLYFLTFFNDSKKIMTQKVIIK